MIGNPIKIFAIALSGFFTISANSWGASATSPLLLSQRPIFVGSDVPPLNMIVLERDHKLYYPAYNDSSDLDDDGTIDYYYKPAIDYYGYFDSKKCYTYGSSRFNPVRITSTKKCGGAGEWSGDFLNYLTMTRMDAVRKVLYGGKRYGENPTEAATAVTVLERALVPQDSHSWVKEFNTSQGYNIRDYTPYSNPPAGQYHLFASTNLNGSSQNDPKLRVLLNRTERRWNWGASEANKCFGTVNSSNCSGFFSDSPTPTDFIVRVQVCNNTVGLEANCKAYSSAGSTYYKPIGMLQQYGESNTMMFGLITGSYDKNLSGGMVRKEVSTITDEINANGTYNTSVVGVIGTIDQLKTVNFNGSYTDCGIQSPAVYMADNICRMWGNPIGEMMYEALRYFSGKTASTPAFDYGSGSGTTDATLKLPRIVSWSDPFVSTTPPPPYTKAPYPRCAKPFTMIMSDIYPSYDSNQVQGSYFPTSDSVPGTYFTGDISGFSFSSQADAMWTSEFGVSTIKSILIGQSGATYNGAPTSKSASSFGSIRGLVPEEPTKQGSYAASAVAFYGHVNDISSAADTQNLTTLSIAFSSPVPQIKIPIAGKTITLVPFAKSAYWGGAGGINPSDPATQPTNSFAGFYIETLTPTYGKFLVNFEDQEKGNDFDLDDITIYEYCANTGSVVCTWADGSLSTNPSGTVAVKLSYYYAAGGITQHIGYVVSGSTADKIYLEVRDETAAGADVLTPLDTGSATAPQPTKSIKVFTPSATGSATILKDPLWYAAKYGGFIDSNSSKTPDIATEWDSTGTGDPDTYLFVTNPTKLETQMQKALAEILKRIGAASAVSTSSTSTSTTVDVYQGLFNTTDWRGELLDFTFDTSTGTFSTVASWNTTDWMKPGVISPSTRTIITYNPTLKSGVPFRWVNLDTTQQAALDKNPVTLVSDSKGSLRVDFLRGDGSNEGVGANNFRIRSYTKLGDIVNSSPIYVGPPNSSYTYTGYSAFKSGLATRSPVVYVGANDGMVHGFSASTGQEVLAYAPNIIFNSLNQLTSKTYNHQFFVDGSPTVADAFVGTTWKTVLVGGLNAGGAGVYALDVSDPSASSFAESNASNLVMWEFTAADDSDLGYTYSKPIIARLNNGRWAAIIGNGYNSTGGKGALFILYLDHNPATPWTPDYVKIDVGGVNNGLSSPVSVDKDMDGNVDYIYAGDLNGNLWRFDLSSSSSTAWATSFAKVFVAVDAGGTPQPITYHPDVTLHPSDFTQYLVYVGTGKYLELTDASTTATQSFYAVWDKFASAPSAVRGNMVQQEIIGTTTATVTTGPSGTSTMYVSTPRPGSGTTGATYASMMPPLPATMPVTSTTPIAATPTTTSVDYRHLSQYSVDWTAKEGWYLDLNYPSGSGERMSGPPVLFSKLVLYNTLLPSTDPCVPGGGSGWLMAHKYNTGGQDPRDVFDTSGDGRFNSSDIPTGGVKVGAVIGGSTIVASAGSGGSAVTTTYVPGTSFTPPPGYGTPGPCVGPGCAPPCVGTSCTGSPCVGPLCSACIGPNCPCTGPGCPSLTCDNYMLSQTTEAVKQAWKIRCEPPTISGGRVTWRELIPQ